MYSKLSHLNVISKGGFQLISIYRIIAGGASGNPGNKMNYFGSQADEVRALVRLEANETLFIVVGQMGGHYPDLPRLLEEDAVTHNESLMVQDGSHQGEDWSFRFKRSPEAANKRRKGKGGATSRVSEFEIELSI